MRVPPQKRLESSSQIKFFFLGWQAAHRIGIVGVPMRVPPSRHSSARPSAPPPQKGLESSSQKDFSSSGIRQQAGIV